MKTFNLLTLLLCLFFSFSCAHHRDVRPGVSGIHQVKVQADDEEDGARSAIHQAQHYCKKHGAEAAFVKEDKKYVGSMDEKNYKMAKNVSKAAGIVGGTMWGLSGHHRRNHSVASGVGSAVGLGGMATNIALGEGYIIEMQFTCM